MSKPSAREQGRRAAARENEADIKNPFSGLADPQQGIEFSLGLIEVQAHRDSGLDMSGHQPLRPHLCATDVTKVCNCCSGCQSKCRDEVSPAQKAPDLIALSGWALVRIATVLERMTIGDGIGTSRRVCSTCGSVIAPVNQPCFVCKGES